jgi:hypothetical protein
MAQDLGHGAWLASEKGSAARARAQDTGSGHSQLYGQVLHQPFENVQAVRADRPVRVLVVMSGTPQLVARLELLV